MEMEALFDGLLRKAIYYRQFSSLLGANERKQYILQLIKIKFVTCEAGSHNRLNLIDIEQ